MAKFNVFFYEKDNGAKPAWDFIISLEPKMQSKVLRGLDILAENGNDLREPYTKPLGDGIFELRNKVGSDISRVLYFFVVGYNIVVTNGFVKKTSKTPKSEIDRAKEYRKDFLNRMEEK